MRKYLSIVWLFLTLAHTAWAAYTPQTVPNVKTANADSFTSNPDNILAPATVSQLDAMAMQLRQQAEVELAVVALSAIDGADVPDFAQRLFNYWGIGGREKNQGVLLLLVVDSREVRIHTGGGIEGVLPDADCREIIEEQIIPAIHSAGYDAGMLAGAQAIVAQLTTQDALEELLFHQTRRQPSAMNWLLRYLMVAFAVLIVLTLVAMRRLSWNEAASNNVRYFHARDLQGLFTIAAILFPLPVALLLLWYKRETEKLRLRPVVCPECKHTMRRLSEAEEDTYLNSTQQAEENVHSVDYDVWECPSCFNHIVLPYVAQQSTYTRCPHCQARTYRQLSDVVLLGATSLHSGKGQRTYACSHCGHRDVTTYVIPRLVVVSGGSGGRSSGGGFSGGSWGGGASFGGGASGRF